MIKDDITGNLINEDVYLPILNTFEGNIKSYCHPQTLYSPFIPYVFPRYDLAYTKIFYIGRDTMEWSDDFMTLSNEGYLRSNASSMDVDRALLYNNKAGAFWNFVLKFHRLFCTGKQLYDINSVSDEDIRFFKEIGYGNLYSIEKISTIQKWASEDYIREISNFLASDYWRLFEEAREITKLKHILKAYSPNIIIILTSEADEQDWFWEDIKVNEFKRNDKLAIYGFIDGDGRKYIEMPHPSRFSFNGTNWEEMAAELYEFVK